MIRTKEKSLSVLILDEEWRDVPGYEGRYQVSNFGRMKGFYRATDKVNGQVLSFFYRNGYPTKNLFLNYNSKSHKIHRLVAMLFVPNPLNKPHVNHKDGVKDNNHYSNLEWVTPSENMQHAIDTKLRVQRHGIRHPKAILTEDQVKYIREYMNGQTKGTAELARRFNINPSSIRSIIKGINWKHLA